MPDYTRTSFWLALVHDPERVNMNLMVPGSTFAGDTYLAFSEEEEGQNLDLRGINFDKTTWLPGAKLVRPEAKETSWAGAHVQGMTIEGGDFTESSFWQSLLTIRWKDTRLGIKTAFQSGSFLKGELVGVDGQGTYWRNWIFDRVKIQGTTLRESRFEGCHFRDCEVSETDFHGSVFMNCRVLGGTWEDIDFTTAIDLNGFSQWLPVSSSELQPGWPRKYEQ